MSVRPLAMLLALFLGSNATAQTSLTINANEQRSIGGVNQLDRARYFNYTESIVPPTNTNLGNLLEEVQSPSGLNLHTGRISTELDQFISTSLPEDPSRPGFIDPNALRTKIRGDYKNFVENGSRWNPNRNADDFFFVQSGRVAAFWPSFFRQSGTNFPKVDPYVEFVNIYLEETLTGPDAFLPVAQDRFHFEIINEPDLHINSTFTQQDYIDFHRDVTADIKAVHPDVSVGGPSLAVTGLEDDNFDRFERNVGSLIAEAGLDFHSIHPYERFSVLNSTTFVQDIEQSVGRIDAMIDLIRNRDELDNGKRSPIAFTEYGSFNRTNTGEYSAYPRDLQQWDQSQAIRHQLLLYLERPDTILNATPFVAPKHFSNTTPTPENADNVFWEQDATGTWSETILAQTFRTYANVKGEYIGLQNDNSANVQSVAFRDGNEVYVLLNNLLTSSQTVDLSVLAGLGGVQSASIDRVFRLADTNFFLDDVDVTNSFENLTLNGHEGAVLTLKLTSDTAYESTTDELTFYGDDTIESLTLPTGRSPEMTIAADIEPANVESVTLRVGYNRPAGFTDGESFEIIFNGTTILVPEGIVGIDDGDFGLQSREIDIDPAMLIDGDNTVELDFIGNGGWLSTAALIVTQDTTVFLAGDYNRDGTVDLADYGVWTSTLGATVTAGSGADGNLDGLNDAADYTVWRDAESAASVAVPEPTTLWITGIACLAIARRRVG